VDGPLVEIDYTPNDAAQITRVVIELCRLTLTETAYNAEDLGGYKYQRAGIKPATSMQIQAASAAALVRSLRRAAQASVRLERADWRPRDRGDRVSFHDLLHHTLLVKHPIPPRRPTRRGSCSSTPPASRSATRRRSTRPTGRDARPRPRASSRSSRALARRPGRRARARRHPDLPPDRGRGPRARQAQALGRTPSRSTRRSSSTTRPGRVHHLEIAAGGSRCDRARSRPEVLANLARVAAQIEADGRSRSRHGAEVVRDAWVANIEDDGLVLTGRIATRSRPERRRRPRASSVTDVDYASILEFGDSRQAAIPSPSARPTSTADEVVDRSATTRGSAR
jgi:hypothetical protein